MSIIKILIAILLVAFGSSLDIYLAKVGVIPFEPSVVLIPAFFLLCLVDLNTQTVLQSFSTVTSKFLACLVFLAVLFSLVGYVDDNMKYIGLAFMNLIFFIFVLSIFNSWPPKYIKIIFFITFTFLTLSVFYDFAFGLGLNSNLRKGGFADNANSAATRLKFLGLALCYFYRNSPNKKWIIAVLIASIMLTFSRGGILGIILILGLLSLNDWDVQIKKFKYVRVLKSGVILICAYFFLFLVLSFLKDIVPSMQEGALGKRVDMYLGKNDVQVVSESDRSENGRYEILQENLDKISENMWGYGTGYTSDRSLSEMSTHNYFLKVGVEYGVIGLLAVVIFVYNLFKISVNRNNYYHLVLAILLSTELVISHSLFDNRTIIIVLGLFSSSFFFRSNKI